MNWQRPGMFIKGNPDIRIQKYKFSMQILGASSLSILILFCSAHTYVAREIVFSFVGESLSFLLLLISSKKYHIFTNTIWFT